MEKEIVTIEIEIICIKDSEFSFENSLDEAVKNIKQGNYTGMDGNDDEEYSFNVKRQDAD